MHIADGIMPVEISIAATATALVLVYAGGRNVKSEEISRMGVFAAALFIVSLIHIPIAGVSIHLGLFGFAGLLFGIRALPIIFVNLLFQTLVFQHGGFYSLGINTITMGSGAMFSALIWRTFKFNRKLISFVCGLMGMLVPAMVMALFFLLVAYGKGMLVIFTAYLIPAVIEGALTVFIYNFFNKVKPEFFK